MSSLSLRIVIADDELDIRDFLKKVLPLLGHSVVAAAENGDELIAACARMRPDLVITDLKMPLRDGVSAIQEIWRTQPVPVIVISAFPEEVTQGPLAGTDWLTLLVKPVRMSDLEPAISLAVQRFQSVSSQKPLPTDGSLSG